MSVNCTDSGDPATGKSEKAVPTSALLDWNVLVTSRKRQQRRLRRALFPLVRLRPCGFRNIFVGYVESLDVFLIAVTERLGRRPELDSWLGKVLPIERTFAVNPARFDQQLRDETRSLLIS